MSKVVVVMTAAIMAALVSPVMARTPHEAGGAGAPAAGRPILGAPSSAGTPAGNAISRPVASIAADDYRGKTGQKCREVRKPGGRIPEC